MNVDRIQASGVMAGKAPEQANSVTDQAAQSADNAIKATQRVANKAFDSLASTAQDVSREATPLLNRGADFAQRGLDAVRGSSRQFRDKAQRASETTVTYIKEEPVKAVLIAAAVGAGIMALVSLKNRSRDIK
jgi:ElaB/YqjD/DUF883 family membrane-anchored ribosome-binding protein